MARPSERYMGLGPVTAFSATIKGAATLDGVRRSYDYKDQLHEGAYSLNPKPISGPEGPYKLSANRDKASNVSIRFDGQGPFGAAPFTADIFFAIDTARSSSFESSSILIDRQTDPGYRVRNASAFLDPFLRAFVPRAYPWTTGGSFDLTTQQNGNDLILPYGTGSRDSFNNTVTDRGKVYINVGTGADVVVGGYGQDYFGSRSRADLVALENIKTRFSSPISGSKLFVGGSGNDVLDGGKDADFLIGDRFGGYELYLPANILKDIPNTWQAQADSLRSYQPAGYSNGSGAGKELLANTPSGKLFGISEQYPLWIPGQDVIRSYGGNDIIFGDDSTMDSNLFQLIGIREKFRNTPDAVAKAGGIPSADDKFNRSLKLGADFIDAGDGDDQVYAGIGADAIIGGRGSDVIYTGAQIIAPGYEPFFGPKVVFGGDAFFDSITGQWTSDPKSYAPNVFILGGLYDKEQELKNSNSGQLDVSVAERKTVAERLAGFEEVWQFAGQVVEKIPKVGEIVKGLVDTVVSLLKLQDPKPLPIGNPPTANDALTIIRDFGSADLLSFNVPDGVNVRYTYGSFTTSISESDNPLAAKLPTSQGLLITYTKTAGSPYDRAFLPGATGLVQRESFDPASGLRTVTLGGSSYSSLTGDDGKLLFSPL